MSFIKYIADENHYKEVLSLVGKAKQTVWIGTADIKDLYVDDKPFLALIASLLKKGVEVRLIHAKEPGTAWREDHEKHPILYDGMERVLCPRVHFKLIIIDSTIAYVGSANLTGAGMGMKSPKKRNFKAGILTDDPEMLEAAIEQFDNVWIGKFFASSTINAARTVATIHCDDELGECHTFNRLPLHRNAPSPSQ